MSWLYLDVLRQSEGTGQKTGNLGPDQKKGAGPRDPRCQEGQTRAQPCNLGKAKTGSTYIM